MYNITVKLILIDVYSVNEWYTMNHRAAASLRTFYSNEFELTKI